MSQTNKTCKICHEVGHSKFYCKKRPAKPIQAKTKKPKRPSRGAVVKELDSVFSQYIRLCAVDELGDTTCVTCGDTRPWKQHQNGHFFTRGRYATRWDKDNCHVQCVKCNIMLHGNYIQYTKYMIDTYGRQFIDKLEKKSFTPVKIPTSELRDMIDEYKAKVALLKW